MVAYKKGIQHMLVQESTISTIMHVATSNLELLNPYMITKRIIKGKSVNVPMPVTVGLRKP